MTLSDYLDWSLRLLGVAYVGATMIARFAPERWAITQWCAKHASDLRDLRGEVGGLR